MTDRIKITKEDFYIDIYTEKPDPHIPIYLPVILGNKKQIEEAQQLKQQILDDNKKIPELEKEIKDILFNSSEDAVTLKKLYSKLERIKDLAYTTPCDVDGICKILREVQNEPL